MSHNKTTAKGLSASSESRANSETDDNKSHESKPEVRRSRFTDSQHPQKPNDVSVVRNRSLWDVAPGESTPKRFGETPLMGRGNGDSTPQHLGETPTPKKFKSNWDSKTPVSYTPQTMNDGTPTQ